MKYTWTFWFSKKLPRQRFEEFAENLQVVGSFKTVRQTAVRVVWCVCDFLGVGGVTLETRQVTCCRTAVWRSLVGHHQIERFWRFYSHMARPTGLEACNIHLFKEGIRPLWEVRLLPVFFAALLGGGMGEVLERHREREIVFGMSVCVCVGWV